ncbi:MAG: hypothetical protein Kow00105_09980 [Phycisphaeraceae bacterium]
MRSHHPVVLSLSLSLILSAVVPTGVCMAADDAQTGPAVETTEQVADTETGEPVETDAPTANESDYCSKAGGNIMDRSDWPTVVVSPADGRVRHDPTYMSNPPLGEDIVSPLHAPDPVWQIQEALRGAEAGNFNGENLLGLVAEPFSALAQIAMMPAAMVIEHPWADRYSPQ